MVAVLLAPFLESTQSENELDRNEPSRWLASRSDVVLSKGAINNIVAGSGTISDLGSGNRFGSLKTLTDASTDQRGARFHPHFKIEQSSKSNRARHACAVLSKSPKSDSCWLERR